jgi:hypothetical protein
VELAHESRDHKAYSMTALLGDVIVDKIKVKVKFQSKRNYYLAAVS